MKGILLDYVDSLFKDDMTLEEKRTLEDTKSNIRLLSDEQCKQLINDKFPFLIEKESLHDRVERIMVERINKPRPDDKEVSYLDYCTVLGQLEGMIHNMSRERLVMGFTHEDLESFMGMKVCQILRRGQYDYKRKASSFFQFVFRNLINDINKCKDSALKECDVDAMSDCLDYNNIKGSDFLDKVEA